MKPPGNPFRVRLASQGREGLEARDGEKPGRDGGPPFELVRLTPDVEKHLTDQVFRIRLVADEAEDKPVNLHMVPREQHLHGEPIAAGDPRDQHLVRCGLRRAQALAHEVSRGRRQRVQTLRKVILHQNDPPPRAMINKWLTRASAADLKFLQR